MYNGCTITPTPKSVNASVHIKKYEGFRRFGVLIIVTMTKILNKTVGTTKIEFIVQTIISYVDPQFSESVDFANKKLAHNLVEFILNVIFVFQARSAFNTDVTRLDMLKILPDVVKLSPLELEIHSLK